MCTDEHLNSIVDSILMGREKLSQQEMLDELMDSRIYILQLIISK